MRDLLFFFAAFLVGILYLWSSIGDFQYLILTGPGEDFKYFTVVCSRILLGGFFVVYSFYRLWAFFRTNRNENER